MATSNTLNIQVDADTGDAQQPIAKLAIGIERLAESIFCSTVSKSIGRDRNSCKFRTAWSGLDGVQASIRACGGAMLLWVYVCRRHMLPAMVCMYQEYAVFNGYSKHSYVVAGDVLIPMQSVHARRRKKSPQGVCLCGDGERALCAA